MVASFAYQHLNLTQNPFGSLPLSIHRQLAVINQETLNTLIPLVIKPNHVLQLLAPQGHGKSTHLLALHSYFPDIPFAQCFESHSDVIRDTSQSSKCHFIDSMENLTPCQRWGLYRHYSTLVVTSIKNYSLEMRLFGKQVTTVAIAVNDSEQLLKILNQRIVFFKRGAGLVPQLTLDDIDHLKSIYHRDIRSMMNALYDTTYRLDKSRLPLNELSHLIQRLT